MPDPWCRAAVRRLALAVIVTLGLAACAVRGEWAPDDAVARAAYAHAAQPSVALVTVVNNRTGAGDHSALVINGSQRILYDPAGTWEAPGTARRNDAIFGFTPAAERSYFGYHARETHHVVLQTLPLSLAQADALIAAAQARGKSPPGYCAIHTSGVLRQLQGLENIPGGFFPKTVMEGFDALPGVERREIRVDGALPSTGLAQPVTG